jgi:UDPglucose 6-dehydrogenase
MTTLAVVGTGYVGLTTGACFAHLGHEVICADIDEAKVENLRCGKIPIVEDGLERLVKEGIKSGRLEFVVGAAAAAKRAEIIFLCVPTPQGADGSADLSYIERAAEQIAPVLPSESVVVNKSTVPVGSTKVVERVLQRPDVYVVSNPEFLREGSAVNDFLKPDRIVIGSESQVAASKLASLYLGVPTPIIVTDPASAETIKYAANGFLAMKISFVNAVAAMCEAVGADVEDVVLGIGYDKRIGHEFLKPGPGWGGSCFPKDSRALVRIAEEHGYNFTMIRGAIDVNEQQRIRMLEKIRAAAGGVLHGARVGVWGLTFKARTDDLRDSPSVAVIHELLRCGAKVTAYDPTVETGEMAAYKRDLLAGVELCADPYAVAEGVDCLVVLTEWDEFRWLDLDKVASVMRGDALVDARNLLQRSDVIHSGLKYYGVGRL